MKPSCDQCAHWNRLGFYRGQCGRMEMSVGSWQADGTIIDTPSLRETRPDYWCIDFRATGELEP